MFLGYFHSSAAVSTVLAEVIARDINMSCAIQTSTVDVVKALTVIGTLVFFTKLSLVEYPVRFLVLFLFFLSNRPLLVFLRAHIFETFLLILPLLQCINDLPCHL